MSKITPAMVKDKQFLPEHFNAVADFDAWLQGVIDTQEALLKIRIGSLYDSADTSIAPQVQTAALSMVCADLTERRILRVSGSVNEDTAPVITTLMKVLGEYKSGATDAIGRLLTAGSSADTPGYSGSVVVTGSESLLDGWPQ